MSSDLHALPGIEVGENLAFGLFNVGCDAANLGIEVEIVTAQVPLEVVEFFRQFDDRLFEIQGGDVHHVRAKP